MAPPTKSREEEWQRKEAQWNIEREELNRREEAWKREKEELTRKRSDEDVKATKVKGRPTSRTSTPSDLGTSTRETSGETIPQSGTGLSDMGSFS